MRLPDIRPSRWAGPRRRPIGGAVLALVAVVGLPAPLAAAASSPSAAIPPATSSIAPTTSTSTTTTTPPTSTTAAATSTTAPWAGPSTSVEPAPTSPNPSGAEPSTPPTTAAPEPQPTAAPEPRPTEPPATDPAADPDDSTTTLPGPLEPPAIEVASAALPLVMPAAATASGQVVIDSGHVDMGPRIVDGQWRVQIRDDRAGTPVWRNLEDVVLHGVDAARMTVPPGSSTGFLGAPGSTIWLLPQVQQADIVWPGWNTQDPSVTSGTTGTVTWTLAGVDGPGELILFMTGSFGAPTIVFDSNGALPQHTAIDPNTHVHGNWAFTQPGIYRLNLSMSATSTTGAALTDSRVLTFAIGAVDPASAFTTTPTTTTSTTSTTTTTSTTPGAGTSTTTTTPRSTAAGPTSTIAHTGANVTAPATLGAASIALGAAALAAARRRPAPAGGSRSRR